MSVQFPYRAIIFGEEHIVKSWNGRKLQTDKGVFSTRHIYGNWSIQDHRLFEVATIQADGNGGWLVNGKPISFLESLPMWERLAEIPSDENLRVYKREIQAVAWFNKTGSAINTTELLDLILKFWNKASLHVIKSDEQKSNSDLLWELAHSLNNIYKYKQILTAWSRPIWLTEFQFLAKKTAVSAEAKKLAKTTTELQEVQAQLRKAATAANDNLKEALSKWMRFDPSGMSADTKARISKAVQMYSTDPEMRSLSKVASEFKVTKKTVSLWFKTFTKETGFPVVIHHRHESVRSHFQADSEKEEEE